MGSSDATNPPSEHSKELSEEDESWSCPTTEPLSLCEEGVPVEALLIVVVEAAEGLPAMDMVHQQADSYCVLKFGTRMMRTPIKRLTRKPKWSQEFRILVSATEMNYDLTIEVWDWDLISNNLIGKCTLEVSVLHQLPSLPLREFKLPIQRSVPRFNRFTWQKNGGNLYISAASVSREEAEQLFWSKYLDAGPIFEGLKTPDVPKKHSKAKEEDVEEPSSPLEEFIKAASPRQSPCDAESFVPDPLLIWQVWLSEMRGEDLNEMIKQSQGHVISQHEKDKALKKEIIIYVRETGKLQVEKVQPAIKRILKLMYANRTGRAVTVNKKLRQFLNRMTIRKGVEYEAATSVRYIQPFIDNFEIDMSQFVVPEDGWKHFNDFFYRPLLPGVRPIYQPEDPMFCVSPCDSRLLVYPTISCATDVWIKGDNFSLSSLLNSEELAWHYEGGSLVIARLAPQDYHRFHSPVKGTVGKLVEVPGFYHTVNPIAVNHPIDIFTTNRRVYTCIHSPQFGMVCYIAIGATMVGSIVFTKKKGDKVQRGDELGYFAFGGSTVLMLFEPGEIEFDSDLIANSLQPLETLVKMGDRIGVQQTLCTE